MSTTLTSALRPGRNLKAKALIAETLLESGVTTRETAKLAGISESTAFRMSARRNINGKQKGYPKPLRADYVEAVKQTIRDRFLLASSTALDHISTGKLKGSSALELAKISSICLENAGLGPTPVIEQHNSFFFQQIQSKQDPTPQPVDITPSNVA